MARGSYHCSQDVELIFVVSGNIYDVLDESENVWLEDAIIECLNSSMHYYGEITDVESGMDIEVETEDGNIVTYVTLAATYYIEYGYSFDGLNISTKRFEDALCRIEDIGELVDRSTIEIYTSEHSTSEWIEDEPDWDRMPGGHDY